MDHLRERPTYVVDLLNVPTPLFPLLVQHATVGTVHAENTYYVYMSFLLLLFLVIVIFILLCHPESVQPALYAVLSDFAGRRQHDT